MIPTVGQHCERTSSLLPVSFFKLIKPFRESHSGFYLKNCVGTGRSLCKLWKCTHTFSIPHAKVAATHTSPSWVTYSAYHHDRPFVSLDGLVLVYSSAINRKRRAQCTPFCAAGERSPDTVVCYEWAACVLQIRQKSKPPSPNRWVASVLRYRSNIN